MTKRISLLAASICCCSIMVQAQSFSLETYYAQADGKKKAELKTAMYNIIGTPDWQSYSSLWTHYYYTDRAADNQVIDRYSNTKRYFNGNNGSQVSGMNKEHGIPKSWWGGGTSRQGSDLHHVMPSDSEANSRKSNYGMGIVTSQTWTNGSIKVGKGQGGNNGTIQMWEPADEWKGDFARAYFYIVTCYEELSMVQQEGANSMQSNTYPKLQPWAFQLYLQWAREDSVSTLERERNEAVYKIQGNRNPFVDYPDLAEYIWGSKINEAFFLADDHGTVHIDPIDPDTITPQPIDPDTVIVNPDAKSGTIDFNMLEWSADTHPEYGAGFTATDALTGLTIGYYKNQSNVNPVSVSQYNSLRLYHNSAFVISGGDILGVTFHAAESKYSKEMTIGEQVYDFEGDVLTWSGSMNPFVAVATGGQSRISSIDVSVAQEIVDALGRNYMSPVDSEVAVFDLQGRYVGKSLPHRRGAYIRRIGDSTQKVVVK